MSLPQTWGLAPRGKAELNWGPPPTLPTESQSCGGRGCTLGSRDTVLGLLRQQVQAWGGVGVVLLVSPLVTPAQLALQPL